jgi:hypothetical protein
VDARPAEPGGRRRGSFGCGGEAAGEREPAQVPPGPDLPVQVPLALVPPAPAPPPSLAGQAQLIIGSTAIVDAAGRTDVVTAGVPVANPRTELVAPVGVVFEIGGAPLGARLRAVTRIRHPDGSGWNPQGPVVLSGPGQAEFDLTLVPAGDHEMSLLTWAADATAKPVSVRLPLVTIRPDPG